MAIGDAYATATQYRVVTGQTGSGDDAPIDRDLKAVSRYIDQALRRPMGFSRDVSAVARIFKPSYVSIPGVLDVDDLVSVTSITIDTAIDNTFATTLATTDYELLPRNAASRPEAHPYTQVELTRWGTRSSWSTAERVKITAVFGWPAVPPAIIDATIELTRILRMESPRATNRANEMNQIVSASRAAQGIIGDLMSAYMNPLVTM